MGGAFLYKLIFYIEGHDINLFRINWIPRLFESAWPRAFLDVTLKPAFSIFFNIFLSYYEQIWLKNCPCEFKPVIYKRYLDDTFLFFRSKDHIEKFRGYLNWKHPNIKFTSEIEENNRFSKVKLVRLIIVFLQIFTAR